MVCHARVATKEPMSK